MTNEVNCNVVCGKIHYEIDVLAEGSTKVYNRKCVLFHSVCTHMMNE